MVAWIKTISYEDATGKLAEQYEHVVTPHGTVDNVMRAHSLRPHTMNGHVVLYKSVLHHEENALPLWFLEMVASYTSMLNDCEYSLTHHFDNARRLLNDEVRSDRIFQAFKERDPGREFSGKELALLEYAGKLTVSVGKMEAGDIEAAREAGADDGEILEVNQVCAYFNYSNRLLNGLGVSLKGDKVGYYSNED